MAHLLAPAMFVALVMVLFVGFPVAFSLVAVGGVFGAIGIATGRFDVHFLEAMVFRIEGIFDNDNLLAVPMLILMGMLMERTGIAADMFVAIERLFGRRPGGLAYTVIIVGAFLSAITGFVSASVMAMGLIALPVMLRAGYDPRLATGVVAASGTLAQVIPPSLVLIVLAEQLDVSVQDIYRGAILPSLTLMVAYAVLVFIMTVWRPDSAPPPAVDPTQPISRSAIWGAAAISAGLPIAIVLIVLSAIYLGIATPTEGGAFGVTGTLLLALVRRRLTFENLRRALDVTAVLVSIIIFLLLGASFFSLVFRGLDGPSWIESLFRHVPAGAIGFVMFVNVVVFFLAFFLDFFEIAFIVLPLVAPIARHLGVDMVWLAVLLAVNLQTSFLHPPFGIALYNLRSVTPPTVRTVDLYLGALPFLVIQLLMVALLIAAPGIVLEVPPPQPDATRKIVVPPTPMPPVFGID